MRDKWNLTESQFPFQGFLIDLLKKARPHHTMHLHCRANNIEGKLFIEKFCHSVSLYQSANYANFLSILIRVIRVIRG